MDRMESRVIPVDLDYRTVTGLKNEAREKLARIRPHTIGQAARISGVDQSDISILLVHVEAVGRRKGDVPRGTEDN
jgi:tRNA uridine 5-carboxymethylaminomethyl modification enzyme